MNFVPAQAHSLSLALYVHPALIPSPSAPWHDIKTAVWPCQAESVGFAAEAEMRGMKRNGNTLTLLAGAGSWQNTLRRANTQATRSERPSESADATC